MSETARLQQSGHPSPDQAGHETYRQRRAAERDKDRLPPPTEKIPYGDRYSRRLPPGLSLLEQLVMGHIRENTDKCGRDFHKTPELTAYHLRQNPGSVRNVFDRLRKGKGKDGRPLLLNDGFHVTSKRERIRRLAIDPEALEAPREFSRADFENYRRCRGRAGGPAHEDASWNAGSCMPEGALSGCPRVHSGMPHNLMLEPAVQQNLSFDRHARTCARETAVTDHRASGSADAAPALERKADTTADTGTGCGLFAEAERMAAKAEAHDATTGTQSPASVVAAAPQDARQGCAPRFPGIAGNSAAALNIPGTVTPLQAVTEFCRQAEDFMVNDIIGERIRLADPACQLAKPKGQAMGARLVEIPSDFYPVIIASGAHRHRVPVTWLTALKDQIAWASRIVRGEDVPADILAIGPVPEALRHWLVRKAMLPMPLRTARKEVACVAWKPNALEEKRAADLIDLVGKGPVYPRDWKHFFEPLKQALGVDTLPLRAEIGAALTQAGRTPEWARNQYDEPLIAAIVSVMRPG